MAPTQAQQLCTAKPSLPSLHCPAHCVCPTTTNITTFYAASSSNHHELIANKIHTLTHGGESKC